MEFDDFLLKYLGEAGIYQICFMIYLGVISIPAALDVSESAFQAGVIDHWCLPEDFPPHLYSNLSRHQLQNLVAPAGQRSGRQCETLQRNYSSLSVEEATQLSELNASYSAGMARNPCREWMYVTEGDEWTTVSQWDLVCDYAWMGPIQSSCFMGGMLAGAFLSGVMSDRFGRRPLALLGLIGQTAARIGVALSPNVAVLSVFKFFTAAFFVTWYTCTYVQGMEILGVRWRFMAGMVTPFGFGIGFSLLAGIAYLERNWMRLTLFNTVCFIPFFLTTWFIPESPRWLYANERKEEADANIRKIARINRRQLPDSWHIDVKRAADGKGRGNDSNPINLVRTINLRIVTIINCILWMVCTLVYYGIIFNASNLAGSVYVNFAINGIVESVSVFILAPMLNTRLGRKIPLAGIYATCGVALYLCAVVPKSYGGLVVCLVMIGKLAISGAFGIVYTYTPEQFPTVLRNAGIGTASTSGRIAGIVAPFIASLGEYSQVLPNVIMGTASLLGALLTLLLPETRGKHLPETLQDGEIFAKLQPVWKKGEESDTDQSSSEDLKDCELQPLDASSHHKENDINKVD